MAKVVGNHLFRLKTGVRAEDFERFVVEELLPTVKGSDIALTICKGERGERIGKYLLLLEFESVVARDHYFPGKNETSEAAKALFSPWWDKFNNFAEFSRVFTDYVAIGE